MGQLGRAARLLKSLVYPPKGSITRYLLERYCSGEGLEIGPGDGGYTDPRTTTHMDKFPPPGKEGDARFIVSDAGTVPRPDGTFDFVLSAHCLEHCPNTLAVLREWMRVLKPGGVLFLILPHAERTFDRGRPLTTLAHHVADEEAGVDETDATHWEEFAQFAIPQHDHAWTGDAKLPDGSWNFPWIVEHGHLHYHAWTQNEMTDVVRHLGGRVLAVLEELPERPDSFLVVARRGG